MRSLLERKIQVAFAVVLAFLILTGATAWWGVQRNAEAFLAVDHTRQVLDQLQATLASLVDTETGFEVLPSPVMKIFWSEISQQSNRPGKT